jgi:D-glycero-D-manno-heptose 1,7-bisphosphate phosphatase
MKTIIMAGGRGSRISTLYPDIPKPLIPIDGVPVLERELCSLRDQGFTDLILTVSHMGDKIMDYFGDGSGVSPATGEPFGVSIRYYNEEQPLGNAGALFKLREQLTEDFLLLNADAVFDVDFNRMVEFHKAHGGLVTLFTHPNSHPYDSGLIIADKDCSVRQWLAKEDVRPTYYKNRVNAGLHVISPAVLDMTGISAEKIGTVDDETGKIVKVDLDRQLLKPLAGSGRMCCYDSPEYVKDMGTPERFHQVEADFIAGRVQAKNLSNKQKAVFLDRDGVINKYVGFLRNIDAFELLPGVAEAIKKINESGYLCIVVTNQPVIARGEVTVAELDEIHNKMETLLGLEGAYIDGLYYCPHHPHKGYAGEIPELKIDCDCRKPKPGMLLKAAEDFNIDLAESWMVGDGGNDVLAGKNAGCRTAFIRREETVADADVTVNCLLEFVGKYLCKRLA